VHDGKITLKGWGYSGGGNWVERVEVSADGWVDLPSVLIIWTDSGRNTAEVFGMPSTKMI
jgi:hypothetical protein